MEYTLDGVKIRLDEAEGCTSELEEKVERNTQAEQNDKRLKKNEDSLRALQNNMKCNKIFIIGISGEEKEQGSFLLIFPVWKNNDRKLL